MPTSLIIVDDFLDNARELREVGLRMHYPPMQGNFPGRNSAQAANLEGLDQEISRLVGEPLVPAQARPTESSASRWPATSARPGCMSMPRTGRASST